MNFQDAGGMLLPPKGQVTALDDLSVTLSNDPHPVWRAFREDIEAHWQHIQEAKPFLFNGTVLLAGRVQLIDGHLSVEVHKTPFATLMWWRENFDKTPYVHTVSMAFPVTAAGEIVAIRMAANTANAGRVYCASGTLDESDLVGASVDIEANMERELQEETGLKITRGQRLHALRDGGRLVIFKVAELGLDRMAVEAAFEKHMAVDEEEEIDGLVFIENAENRSENFASFMQPIITWVFEEHCERRMD